MHDVSNFEGWMNILRCTYSFIGVYFIVSFISGLCTFFVTYKKVDCKVSYQFLACFFFPFSCFIYVPLSLIALFNLANLYNFSIDELYDYDKEYIETQNIINNTNDNLINKIDWTKAWSKKYPILGEYQKQIDIEKYALRINKILEDLKSEYKFNDLDAMLVLKDIIYKIWKNK